MKLNTYASEVVRGCFVTLPSATAASTISLVDDLAALQLHLFKHAYSFPRESSGSPFIVSVLTQIVDRGYAVHGSADASFPHEGGNSRSNSRRTAS